MFLEYLEVTVCVYELNGVRNDVNNNLVALLGANYEDAEVKGTKNGNFELLW